MASINKVILLGNLGRDPEVRTFENGSSICTFSIATTDSYYDREKNQRVELPTEWHNIRLSRPGLIKVAQQYLKKGSQVYIEGTIRSRQYQTKEGENRTSYEIVVTEMVLTGGRPASQDAPPAHPAGDLPSPPMDHPTEDDLPF